ncbi:LCP family protein [Ruminococcaceae bacterium OttesenSCG-928-A16]|nr:LCP family protein [Ruminococcaceae bacterium OttesenSCG-928-A16]
MQSPYLAYYQNLSTPFSTTGQAQNSDVVNLLVLCLDTDTEAEANQATMHQADTLLLCSFNKKTGDMHILSVPRNIVIAMPHFDVLGDFAYLADEPLCNAHALGKTPEDAMMMTLAAVQVVLGGLPIHGVATVELRMIESLVDALGGITVDCFFDIAHYYGVGIDDPITLDGPAAMEYVRARSLPGMDGSNETRMMRQISFLASLYTQTVPRIKANPFLAAKLYFSVKKDFNTSLSLREIAFMGGRFLGKGSLSFHTTAGQEQQENLFTPDYDALYAYLAQFAQ